MLAEMGHFVEQMTGISLQILKTINQINVHNGLCMYIHTYMFLCELTLKYFENRFLHDLLTSYCHLDNKKCQALASQTLCSHSEDRRRNSGLADPGHHTNCSESHPRPTLSWDKQRRPSLSSNRTLLLRDFAAAT